MSIPCCCLPAKDFSISSYPAKGFCTISIWGNRQKERKKQKQDEYQLQGVVGCCEKPTPAPKKIVRIQPRTTKTDLTWRNVNLKKEAKGVRLGGGSSFTKLHIAAPDANKEQKTGSEQGKSGKEESAAVPQPGVMPPPPQAPLLDALQKCAAQDTAAFHFPGHQRGFVAPPAMADSVSRAMFAHDLPELTELDNLFAPAGVIAEAQKKAAIAFGAGNTYFLVNGSTCGIQAAIMATCKPGDVLILPRNCHLSAISGMVLSGTLPWYVIPNYDSYWGVSHGVSREAIEIAIARVHSAGGRVGAVLIVSPTYYGVCSPIGDIAQVCFDNEVPLIVDEAHGAHFRFHEDFPSTALEQGADIAVQSTHKVLGSLTQSSMLHVKEGARVDQDLLLRCLQMVQSSSPSYLLLSSLDAARAQMSAAVDEDVDSFNSQLLGPAVDLAAVAKQLLREVPNLVVMDEDTIQGMGDDFAGLDPLRITVGLWRLSVNGYQADDVLRTEFGVICELPSMQSLTFAMNSGTTVRDIARLVEAMKALSIWFPKENDNITMEEAANNLHGDKNLIRPLLELPPTSALSPRDAFFCKTVKVDTDRAVGQISAELLCPYPPGIPVITPGEVITEEALAYLKAVMEKGGTVSGASDPNLYSISVCQR
ncbi:unnamed protein product [Calypogeia fissa]